VKTLVSLLKALVSPSRWPLWRRGWPYKAAYLVLAHVVGLVLLKEAVYPAFFRWYTGDKSAVLSYDTVEILTTMKFEKLAANLQTEALKAKVEALAAAEKSPGYRRERERLLKGLPSLKRGVGYDHIRYFREAGVLSYKGPETCLSCHKAIRVIEPDGSVRERPLMQDVMETSHFQLFAMRPGFSTYGYDGRQVNEEGRSIPVGKVDRACGIPGSFTWTGWAALIEAKPKDGKPHLVSEGCGQCHIGGMYGPASDLMMPVGIDDAHREQGIDCLICHSDAYDMNRRYVIDDGVGLRWNQDRSMKAALTVGRPTATMCLRCHQHNMGGDTYVHNQAAKTVGYQNQRLLHGWSKRGAPFAAFDDVHAKAGMECLDCHQPVGHRIPRGSRGVDLVSNDLPGVEVSCEKCHTAAPHFKNERTRAFLNGHTARMACQTCHITKLQEKSVVLIDWATPTFNEEEGVWTPTVKLASGDVRTTVGYLWYNGSGSFLANALGDNPSNPGVYNPLMDAIVKYNRIPGLEIEGVTDNDFLSPMRPELVEKRRRMVADNIQPHQEKGRSKLQPFHLFNARMYEDMNNQGPFGAMIMPFDYKTYFETGDTLASVKKAIAHPIVVRMYQTMFKVYMMDDFMKYFGIEEGWKPQHPLAPDYPGKIEPHWMRQMGTIALNHGIRARGFGCVACHAEGGLMRYDELGYSPERSRELVNLPELKMFEGVDTGATFEELYRSQTGAPVSEPEGEPI